MQNRVAISLKLPPDLLALLDAYCQRLPHAATRTQVIEDAIRDLLDQARSGHEPGPAHSGKVYRS
jgi:metal-responsive CopG/Arc/MetJ family transcriptional regulator